MGSGPKKGQHPPKIATASPLCGLPFHQAPGLLLGPPIPQKPWCWRPPAPCAPQNFGAWAPRTLVPPNFPLPLGPPLALGPPGGPHRPWAEVWVWCAPTPNANRAGPAPMRIGGQRGSAHSPCSWWGGARTGLGCLSVLYTWVRGVCPKYRGPGVSVCPEYTGWGCLSVLIVWVQGVCPKYEAWGVHLP